MSEIPESLLDEQTIAVLGSIIGAVLLGIRVLIQGARSDARVKAEPATQSFVGNEMIDVKGEVRQMRQELRLEHAATRRHTEDEIDKLSDRITALRDILVEIRVMRSGK
ncbi:hypothetical protein [Paracoccus sp. JM45]|uniref:hypothetical protein n=1 Tax=Paracoccus sp. JM45 TaxID=2283626 RepID=UPI000E6BC8E0|nr:hypothetical protein [Paracoccus sp. JM45]RJE81263.1 hypothetical protein DWB67_00985 [Paracoccus sp. JM45]